jgi:hypothetical protein
MAELLKMLFEDPSRHFPEALSQEQLLPLPLAPQLSMVLHWLSPTSRERGVPWPRLFVARTAVVFIFFPQVGLQMAICLKRWPTGRQCLGSAAARRVLIFSPCGSSRATGAGTPQSQSTDINPWPCPDNAATYCLGVAKQKSAGPVTRPVTLA